MLGALGPEHRVGADDVEVARQQLQQQCLGELLDGKHINDQGVSPEALKRQRFEDGLGGEDGGAEQNDLWVLFAEIVWVGEERNAEVLRRFGVVGSGMGEDGVALGDEGLGEELAIVAESDNGDLEHVGVVELGGDFGLVVVELGSVERLDFQRPGAERAGSY